MCQNTEPICWWYGTGVHRGLGADQNGGCTKNLLKSEWKAIKPLNFPILFKSEYNYSNF